MNLLFVNGSNGPRNPYRRGGWISILCEQIVNACIVGGIAGLSVVASAPGIAWLKAAGIAFGITFLIELRKYRKL